MADRVGRLVLPLLGSEAGRVEHGVGAGGDRTVELDRLAEEAALAELRAVHQAGERFSLLSEEVGAVDLGAPFPLVLLDPVDGSLNAKQGLPVVGLMLTLLEGPTLAAVRIGYVANLVSGERWHAVRGAGAHRNGRRLRPLSRSQREGFELLALESSPENLGLAAPLVRAAGKVRLLGSMALSLAHTASGGIEVFASPVAARVFDLTASALMITEVGGVVTDLEGRSLAGLEAGLTSRSTVLGSAHPEAHAEALARMREGA